jgi:hypothetical protein
MEHMSGPKPTVFIGSSSEGLHVAHTFQVALEASGTCEATVWDQDVFEVSAYTMTGLLQAAQQYDFAALVATGDDITESRGITGVAPRDNVVFELGLFMGALGHERVMILCPAEPQIRLPSDVAGITRLPSYGTRDDGNLRAAIQAAALAAGRSIAMRGRRTHDTRLTTSEGATSRSARPNHRDALARDLDLLCENATDQGWRIRTRSETTLRLEGPRRRRRTYTIPESAEEARRGLRGFVGVLRADGLRVNSRLRRPVPVDTP